MRAMFTMPSALVAILFFVFSASANFKKADQTAAKQNAKIENLVKEYILSKSKRASVYAPSLLKVFSYQKSTDDECLRECERRCYDDGDDTSCVDTVCEKLDSYECDDASELERVSRMCRNQRGGSCINSICRKLDDYECDDLSELEDIAEICVDTNSECVDTVCSKLDDYECDDISELQRVGTACQRFYDVDCINATCRRLDSYECDDISELENIIRICRGR